MRLIVRLSVRALYCDMALKSSMNMIHSDFQSASALRSISSGSSSSDIASTSNFHRVGTDILSSSDANFDHSTEINSLPQTRVASSIAEMGKEFVGLCDFDCNILHRDLTADKDRLIESALELGITYFMVPGSGLLESRAILDLAKVEKRIALIGTAGVHPYAALTDVHSQDALKQLEVMVTDAECYAVGECGLDYSTGFPDKEPQIEWFR